MASRIEQKQQARAKRVAAEEAARRNDRRRARLMRLGLVLSLALVVVIVGIVVSSGGGSSNASPGGGGNDAAAANALFKGIPQNGIHLGDPKAKATLIEFADLQCPFCKEYSDAALPTVIKRYVRPGTLRYELHMRSFIGPDSQKAAAAAAVATRQDRLYQFSDLFYRRQHEENTGYVTSDFIRSIATGSGVDAGKAVKAASDPSSEPLVAQAEKTASDLGSTSTPDFFLRLSSGRLVRVQPQSLTADGVTQAIDAALPGT
jgi:protein-disulfide isomerase